jgi:HAD superfamily hydrolase (TIGR01509 family)
MLLRCIADLTGRCGHEKDRSNGTMVRRWRHLITKQIGAVLWDNDGVLVDSETRFFETTRVAFARIRLTLTREIWARHYLAEGMSSHEIAAMMGAESNRIVPMLEERNREYMQVLRQPPPLRPQVRETLTRLFGRVKMAIVTGCYRNQLQLMHGANGLLDLFDAIVTGDECPNPKPHPDLYLAGLKVLGVPAERCLAVEDSPRGLAAARAAGVACLVVPTELTRDLSFAGALSVEPDVSAVLNYLPGQR